MLSNKSGKAVFRSLRLSHVSARTLLTSTFQVKNPYTLENYCEFNYKSASEMQHMVKEAFQKHRQWKRTTLDERIKVVEKAAEYFIQNQDAIAKDITCQMGKPITQSLVELKGFHNVVKKLIQMAPEALGEKVVQSNGEVVRKYSREAVGVAAIYSPWNYPVLTCANLVFPNILAGNSVVIKHSPLTPLIAKHFEESFKYAGTELLVNECMIEPKDALLLYEMPEIGFISFTGSTAVGRNVQREITNARFPNFTLELGGNDAAYVAEDADVDYAAKELITGAMYNAGQSCNGIARIYVHSSIYQDFLDKAVKYTAEYKLGDPMKEDTTMGPLPQAEKIEEIKIKVEEAAQQGGKILIGGKPAADADGKGQFFEPTVIADARNEMSFLANETFGPVVGVASIEGDEEAVRLINDSEYGLTAAIFSKNKDRIMQLAPKLNVGTVYGNRAIHVEPQLPWSGRKNSGSGVSLSLLGFDAVTRSKSSNINLFL